MQTCLPRPCVNVLYSSSTFPTLRDEIWPISGATRKSTTKTTILWYWCQARIQTYRDIVGRNMEIQEPELNLAHIAWVILCLVIDTLWAQTLFKVITAGRPEWNQRQERWGRNQRLNCNFRLESKDFQYVELSFWHILLLLFSATAISCNNILHYWNNAFQQQRKCFNFLNFFKQRTICVVAAVHAPSFCMHQILRCIQVHTQNKAQHWFEWGNYIW